MNASAWLHSLVADGVVTSDAIVAAAAFVLGLLICLLNLLTVTAVCRVGALRTVANMHVVSLAAADLLVGLVLPVYGLSFVAPFSLLVATSKAACTLIYTWLYVSVTSSVLTLSLVSLDRYVFILHPFLYQRRLNARNTGVVIVLAWGLAVAWGTVPAYWNHFDDPGVCRWFLYEEYERVAGTAIFSGAILITGTFYGLIVRFALKKQKEIAGLERRRRSSATASVASAAAAAAAAVPFWRKRQWRAVKLFLVVYGVFLFCWLPQFVSQAALTAVGASGTRSSLYRWFYGLGFLNSGMNFFIYAYMNKDFRSAFRSFLCRKKTEVAPLTA